MPCKSSTHFNWLPILTSFFFTVNILLLLVLIDQLIQKFLFFLLGKILQIISNPRPMKGCIEYDILVLLIVILARFL